MPRVLVKFVALFYEIMGTAKLEVVVPEDTTLGQLIDLLSSNKPELREVLLDEDGKVREEYNVLVNGISASSLDGVLRDGDEVVFLPPASGGEEM